MTMTTNEVLELVTAATKRSVRAGMLLRRAERRRSNGELPSGQVALLKVLQEKQRQTRVPVSTPAHPETEAERSKAGRRREKGADLEPAELAWIQRLPLDPREVSFEDAVQLAALANGVSAMKSPASARLVDSVWLPVKEIYDLRLAEARMSGVSGFRPDAPREVLCAIEDAVSKQYPNLRDEAINQQARAIVRDFQSDLEAGHDGDVDRAARDLKAARDAIAARNSTAKDVLL